MIQYLQTSNNRFWEQEFKEFWYSSFESMQENGIKRGQSRIVCPRNAFSRNETESVSTQQNFKERNKYPLITRLSQNKTFKTCAEHNILHNSFPNDINGHVSFCATEDPLSGNFQEWGGNRIRYSLKFLSTRNFASGLEVPRRQEPSF